MSYQPQWDGFASTAKSIIQAVIPHFPYAWAKVRSVDDGEFARHFVNACHALGHTNIRLNGKRGTTAQSRDAVCARNETGCSDTSNTFPGLSIIDFVLRHECPSAAPAWADVTVDPETGQFYTSGRVLPNLPDGAEPIPAHHVELGCSVFGLIAMYRDHRLVLARNLRTIADDLGASYVRGFFTVGGDLFPAPDGQLRDPWELMGAFFDTADHEEMAAEVTDFCFDQFALQVQWTLIGSRAQANSRTQQQAICDRFIRIANARADKVVRVDIWNEYRVNGGTIPELHWIYDYLRPRLDSRIPIGMSSPSNTHAGGARYDDLKAEVRELYGTRGDFIPSHNERGESALYGPGCYRGMLDRDVPVGNNEPAGPGASAGGDVTDAFTIASDYMGSIAAGDRYYTFHSHWGVFQGYLPYWPDPSGEDITDEPNFAEIARTLKALKDSTYSGPGPTQPGGGDVPLPPYDESWLQNIVRPAVIERYSRAGAALDDLYPTWIARTLYDHCAGMTKDASLQKHLHELEQLLGL